MIEAAPADAPPPAATQEDEILIIDEGDAAAPSAPPPVLGASRTWLTANLRTRLVHDLAVDAAHEDTLEWWNLARLRLDHRQNETLSAVTEAWVRWGVVGEEPARGRYWGLNADERKWTGLAELREAYVQWRPGAFELAGGAMIFVWGKNELLPPADVLNPLDLRFDPVTILRRPKDAKVPVVALDASYLVDTTEIELVVLPFFTPHRAFVYGRDFALAAPESDLDRQARALGLVDPSIEDELQQGVPGSSLPEESPYNASVALRLSSKLGGVDVAATAYYGWDRTPRVQVDPDAAALLLESERILGNPGLLATDPELRRHSIALQQKAAVGQEVFRARYERMAVVALEGEGVVGDFVLRLDVGFSPELTFYTEEGEAVALAQSRGVAGVEYTYGDSWFVQLTGFASAAHSPPDDAFLLGIENTDGSPSERPVALLWGGAGTLRWRWVEHDLEALLLGAYTISPGDYLVSAEVSYVVAEPHTLRLGATVLGGRSGATLERYSMNDFAYVEYEVTY